MNILVLKSYGLGNAVMATPMIKSLYEAGHRISIITDAGPLGGPVKQLLEGWEFLDEIIEFNPEQEKDATRIVNWVNSKKFDICIQSFPSDSLFDWLIAHIKCPLRKHPHVSAFWDKHEVDYNISLVGDLINEKWSSQYSLPVRNFPRVDSLINKNEGEFAVAICPSYKKEGLWWKKHWGTENYAELIKLLPDNLKFYLIDGKDGVDTCNYIKYQNKDRVINLAGLLDIQETCAALSKMDLVIANDSGLAHIAAAYDRTLLVFFGPTSIEKNKPIGPNTLILKTRGCPWIQPCQGTEFWQKCQDPVCLTALTPKLVAHTIGKYLFKEVNV